MSRTCDEARYWGNGRRAWRCDLPRRHEGKHLDKQRGMYWGDAWDGLRHSRVGATSDTEPPQP